MSITSDSSSSPIVVPRLSFAGTVDRALIHRRNPGEAFLTDAVRTGSHGFAAAALLPPAHPHYGAHTGPSRQRDPMLLLECARQAMIFTTHTMFGVEVGVRIVLRNWSGEFAADAPPAAAGPVEVLITGEVRNPRLVGGQVRGLDYELELWAEGTRAGRVRMEAGYVSDAAYTAIRSRKHHGSPPSSDDLPAVDGCLVAPPQVGRIRATDALLSDVAAGAPPVTARLRVPAENPSLFDHAQDHVPGMVLVEAARQLAALATWQWGGAPPDRTQMVAMSSSFGTFAELNEPVEMTATAATAAVPADGRSADVTFRQAGADIVQVHVVMAIPGWMGRGRRRLNGIRGEPGHAGAATEDSTRRARSGDARLRGLRSVRGR